MQANGAAHADADTPPFGRAAKRAPVAANVNAATPSAAKIAQVRSGWGADCEDAKAFVRGPVNHASLCEDLGRSGFPTKVLFRTYMRRGILCSDSRRLPCCSSGAQALIHFSMVGLHAAVKRG